MPDLVVRSLVRSLTLTLSLSLAIGADRVPAWAESPSPSVMPQDAQPATPPSPAQPAAPTSPVAPPPDQSEPAPGLPALQAMLDRANAAILADRPDLAADLYRQVIALAAPDNPQRVVAHLGWGSLLNNRGEIELAIAQFDQAIALAPDSAIGYTLRGLAFYDLERWDDSIADLQQAIKLDPQNPQIRVTLANSFYERQDFAGVIEQLQAAVALQPDYPIHHYNLGMILEERGQIPEAIAHYQQAATLDPADPEIQAALDRLRAQPSGGSDPLPRDESAGDRPEPNPLQ